MAVEIISRSQWGARAPKGRHTIATPTPRLWIHHTAGFESGASGMRAIQAFHMGNRGWLDIAYSFVIDNADGRIYEGRGAGVAGGHTEGDNSKSHAICVMGNFESAVPTVTALASIVALARYGKERGWWVPTCGGHRDAPGAQTACPGRNLYARLPDIRAAVASGSTPRPPVEDDMTPEQATTLANISTRLIRMEDQLKAVHGRAPGYFAKVGDTGTVYYVDTSHQSKVSMPVGGALHELLKFFHAGAGFEVRAAVLSADVLDAIPDAA